MRKDFDLFGLWSNVTASLWFRPAIWVLALAGLAFLISYVDRLVQLELPWFLLGSPEGVRGMLTAIASAMLTVASLTYSLMMLVVAQVAESYSPRLLRQYMSDEANQNVLGIFIGTFVYSLLVLRGVRLDGDNEFVPILATNVALLLTLLSTAALVYFIDHIADSIKVANIIQRILDETAKLLDEPFPANVGQPWDGNEPPDLPDSTSTVICAEAHGYVRLVEIDKMIQPLAARGLVMRLEQEIGNYVISGMPLATLWPTVATPVARTRWRNFLGEVRNSIALDRERTLDQDIRYGVRHLSDIAIRALSPSLNDPTTARECINALGVLLAKMADTGPITPYRCDEAGMLRIIAPAVTFNELLQLAFDQIRHYGSSDVSTLQRLIEISGEIGRVATKTEVKDALWRHVTATANIADRTVREEIDRLKVNRSLAYAAKLLGRDPEELLL